MDLVVGFDLDLTLVDSGAGIAATMKLAAAEVGVVLTDEQIWPSMGVPLDMALRPWLPEELIPAAVAAYRRHYPEVGVPMTTRLPGAAEALDAVHRLGGRAAIISAKAQPAVRAVLDRVGLTADWEVGGRFAEEKAVVLREIAAQVYVGDHPGDVVAAHGAAATAVVVTTGETSADALRAAGADVVLGSLEDFPGWLEEHVLGLRTAALEERLRDLVPPASKAVVAFSGGADSAYLLAAAARALGPDRVLAATAVSPSLATGELAQAADFAAGLGVRHITADTHELERDGYAANAGDRCYHCKSELVDVLQTLGEMADGGVVLTGTNADDARAGFRPGIRAADERGAHAPLRDVGMTKAQVREASRRWGLATWDKPAAACLSSRVAFGVPVTRERLERVDRAETAVRRVLAEAGVGRADLRVRDLGEDRARVELGHPALEAGLDAELVGAVLGAGFAAAAVDPRGFRSGSMNELLPQPELFR